MSTDQVQQILDAVKAASPVLWNAAHQQVVAQIVQDVFGVVVLSLLTVFAVVAATRLGIRTTVKKLKDPRDSYDPYEDNMGWGLATAAAVLVGVAAFGFDVAVVNDLIQKVIAPDYATIQALTGLLPGH